MNLTASDLRNAISTMVTDVVTKEEFVKAFELVLRNIMSLRLASEQEITGMRQKLERLSQKIVSDNEDDIKKAKQEALDYCSMMMKDWKKSYDSMISAMEQKILEVDNTMALVKDGKDADEINIIAKVLSQVPSLPPPLVGEDMRNALESLQGEDRLKSSAILGLDELEKKINAKIDAVPRGGARSSHTMRFTDLSTKTNGVLKVFAVPEGLVGVLFSSDFPTVLMEGNGFTLNASRTQLTMTTPTAPSSGSQLLYQSTDIHNY